MQCNQLQLQITRDQPDNIKLYDRKIEKREPNATECKQCRLTKNAFDSILSYTTAYNHLNSPLWTEQRLMVWHTE